MATELQLRANRVAALILQFQPRNSAETFLVQSMTAANFFHSVHGVAYDLQAALEELIGIAPDARQVGFNSCVPTNALAFQVQLFHLHGAAGKRADIDKGKGTYWVEEMEAVKHQTFCSSSSGWAS